MYLCEFAARLQFIQADTPQQQNSWCFFSYCIHAQWLYCTVQYKEFVELIIDSPIIELEYLAVYGHASMAAFRQLSTNVGQSSQIFQKFTPNQPKFRHNRLKILRYPQSKICAPPQKSGPKFTEIA